MKAAFIPEVNDELDTQNFEKFEEVYYICSFLWIWKWFLSVVTRY